MTEFEYACFVSYRNSRDINGLISTFARELSNALEKYLDAYLPFDISRKENPAMVFFDENVIQTGNFLPFVLGQGLSKSVCWITILIPNYLGGSLWCASELYGMLYLQRERERLLQINPSEHSFILPIWFKGDISGLPSIFESPIVMKDFAKFTLSKRNIYADDDFIPYIESLATIIAAKQKVLVDKCQANNIDLLDTHKAFALRDVNIVDEKEEIKAFVESIRPSKPQAFPTT